MHTRDLGRNTGKRGTQYPIFHRMDKPVPLLTHTIPPTSPQLNIKKATSGGDREAVSYKGFLSGLLGSLF